MKILHILCSSRSLDTFPSVYNAIYLMKKRKIKVDLAFGGPVNSVPQNINIDKFIAVGENVFRNAFLISEEINNYDYVVAYEPSDLELIGIVSKILQIKPKIIFHNLEIPFYKSEQIMPLRQIESVYLKGLCTLFYTIVTYLKFKLQNTFLKKLWILKYFVSNKKVFGFTQSYFYNHRIKKNFFSKALRKVCFFLIQDKVRLGLFLKHYELKTKNIILVPNAYIPDLEVAQYKKKNSPIDTYISAIPKFELIKSDSRKKILYIGSIEAWALDVNLIKTISTLKDNLWIFSGWSRDGFIEQLNRELDLHKIDNIFLNSATMSIDQLNSLILCCDIGLCYYKLSSNDNVNYMGLSSGKFHKFLTLKKPVLVSNGFIGFSDFTQKHHFGETFDLTNLHAKVIKILHNYSYYQKNISTKYFTVCSFKNEYEILLRKIEKTKKQF